MVIFFDKVKRKFSGEYIQNVGWLGAAEVFNRFFRLGTTVTLARVFSAEDYGLMAIVYTSFEFASVFTLQQGIGGKIVQTEAENLFSVCKTAYWINWFVCIFICLGQCLAAFPIAWAISDTNIIMPLCGLSLIYLMFPHFMVQSSLVTRENRLKIMAICNALQSFVSNLITIVMALAGFGIWSVVAGMVLSTPVWIVVNRMNHDWRPPKSIYLKDWRTVVSFGRNILLIELLQKLRLSLDYLIIGPTLGLEKLGTYFFAYNAGSGITTNVVQAMIKPLFPKFCELRQDQILLKRQYTSSLILVTKIVGGMILLQCLLAPLYVPIVFGEKWVREGAIPLLILICLSVLPRAYGWVAAALLNAKDKTHLTLATDIGFTLIFGFAILAGVQFGILGVATAVLLSHIVVLIPLTLWVAQHEFPKLRSGS